jgi:bifunctional non-homologous end joining protein LigD
MAGAAATAKLAKYRSMRDFARTAEPRGGSSRAAPGSQAGRGFVIQQHAARRMHYDFRLELDGVLLSWSVPKGPSLSPKQRRLAVRTEDHPIDYADFEGVIPAGQYGGGTVIVWDRGTWQAEGDAQASMKAGKLTFALDGHKLHGRWHLVRTKSQSKQDTWLLFKGRDDAADDRTDIITAEPASVLSGRTLDEVAAAPERVWQSHKVAEPTVAARRAARISATGAARPARARSAANGNAEAERRDIHGLIQQLPLGFSLTNLDKVLYPEHGLTKGELIAYLAVVADHALPHVADRPLTLVRCPEGIAPRGRARACFFQKHIVAGSPAPIDTVAIAEDDGETAAYMQIHDMPGLAALGQLGALEIHTWGAHADRPESPDVMVFDLDPDVGLGWDKVVLGALELRRRLNELGLESFVKTTGGKGLHVVAPIRRGIGWDDFKRFTRTLVEAMARTEPAAYTTNPSKAQRKGKIFLDYLRNGRGATFIAPYSPRARPGAPVAVPLTWEELAHGVDPASFTTKTVPRRLITLRADPWQRYGELNQSITEPMWRALEAEADEHRAAAARRHAGARR